MDPNLDFDGLASWALDIAESNAPTAGGFIVHDARRRLQSIQEPQFGQGYRRKIVASLLDFLIDRGSDYLDIVVGIKKTPESDYHGFYIETGSKTAKAQPFLRPAVIENARRILELLIK